MVWIAIAFVCVLSVVIFVLIAYKSKLRKIDATKKSITLTDEVPPVPVDLHPVKDTTDKVKRDERHRPHRETTSYGRSDKATKTYTIYDRKGNFDDSIRTPFIDESSPATPYLHQAYELEKEGADLQRIEELLEIAIQLDANTTIAYRTRLDIIKKKQNRTYHN